MSESPGRFWPGFDRDFGAAVLEQGHTPEGTRVREELESSFLYAEGKPFLLGPPLAVRAGVAPELVRLTSAYHRAVESVVRASLEDGAVREVLCTPADLCRDLEADTDPANGRVHICRLDLMLDEEGGYWILETNANCPGGFVYSGEINRSWREFLEARGVALPAALPHEHPRFMADWFLRVAEAETGRRPERVALLREEGGNRLELGTFRRNLADSGVEAFELDPRRLAANGAGGPLAPNGELRHAYLKLGMQAFLAMRGELEPFVAAVRERRLFVQNGQRGRWVGDNKLCLAVISDPAFDRLFDPEDIDFLRSHLPWSRNVRLVEADRLRDIRRDKDRYVLKRCLDTRGRGVVVGRGVEQEAWEEAVDRAVAEGWLVQEFRRTTETRRDFDGSAMNLHDLALGAIDGALTTVFTRSSSEWRVNMARTGRFHPVFFGA